MNAKEAALAPESALYEALHQKASAEVGEGERQVVRSAWARLDEWVVGGLAFAALLLCSYNVVVRFFLPQWTLEWADEVQVYVIVWGVLLALGAVTLADRHVKADLFVSMFPPRMRRATVVFVDLLGLAFALVLLWNGAVLAYQSWSFGDVSTTSLRFPMWVYVAALPAGALALAAGYAVRLLRHVRQEAA